VHFFVHNNSAVNRRSKIELFYQNKNEEKKNARRKKKKNARTLDNVEHEETAKIRRYTYPGSRLSMSQISMFKAQSGPTSMLLVARSTKGFTIVSRRPREYQNVFRCDEREVPVITQRYK